MSKYALIQGTRVCEVVNSQSERFDVHNSLSWVACGDEVTDRYTYESGQFIAPTADPAPTYQELRSAAYADAELTTENYIDEMRKER